MKTILILLLLAPTLAVAQFRDTAQPWEDWEPVRVQPLILGDRRQEQTRAIEKQNRLIKEQNRILREMQRQQRESECRRSGASVPIRCY